MKNRALLFPVLCLLLMVACSQEKEPVRAIYHWKTTYNPTQYELDWLRDHHVTRLYLHLFDVDVHETETAAPIATTRFLQVLPDGMEIVPVVYITNEAMDKMYWESEAIGRKIVERVLKMAECKGFEVKELQVDCDWTERTKDEYYRFCHYLQEMLHERGIRLSSTVRLHQIEPRLDSLEVDNKTLMLYNTGNLRSPKTRNSILDYDDVAPYLSRLTAGRLQDMALVWPVFGWGVAFKDGGQFSHLVNSAELGRDTDGLVVREEWGEMEQMRHLWKEMPERGGERVTILYHLDSLNLSKYSYDEIEEIYSR